MLHRSSMPGVEGHGQRDTGEGDGLGAPAAMYFGRSGFDANPCSSARRKGG
jgi:hypothetical protein